MLGVFLPFLLKFLGEGAVQSWLKSKTDQMNSANELQKVKLSSEVQVIGFELQRRQAQRDLQIAEMPYKSMRYPKSLLMWSVALFWAVKFNYVTFGLGDFHIVVGNLDPAMTYVSTMVLGYLFLGDGFKRLSEK